MIEILNEIELLKIQSFTKNIVIKIYRRVPVSYLKFTRNVTLQYILAISIQYRRSRFKFDITCQEAMLVR